MNSIYKSIEQLHFTAAQNKYSQYSRRKRSCPIEVESGKVFCHL